jgi:mono/diheme cytochrome c family protein
MNIKKTIGISALFFGLSTAAFAFPWDIDMVDSLFVRGYEKPMMTPPEGAISQNNYRPAKTVNPYEGRETELAVLEKGEVAFRTYCQTCHGYKGTLQTKEGNDWPIATKFTVISLARVSGTTDTLTATALPNDYIYDIIRNGRNNMPGYTHAMSEEEIWSTIVYLKSLTGQKRTAKLGE